MVIRHAVRLALYLVLLIFAVALSEHSDWLLTAIWIFFAVQMMFCIVPNKDIAIGARKHFAGSYDPGSDTKAVPNISHKGAAFCALGWFAITVGMVITLHFLDMLTAQTVLIIALGYAVVDVIFILFFCPFRGFFMRNRCCATCRIHNWDWLMKCAVLILFPSFFSVSLFALSVVVLLRWEVSLWRNPHYFSPKTNQNLQCATCVDKLCRLRIRKWGQRGQDTHYK